MQPNAAHLQRCVPGPSAPAERPPSPVSWDDDFVDDDEYEVDTTPWSVHLEAAQRVQRLQQVERDAASAALFFSGPAPDWLSLPPLAWERVIEYLDCRGAPSGANNLYLAILGSKAHGDGDEHALLRAWLQGRQLRAGQEGLTLTLHGDGNVEITSDSAQELEQLCEAVALEDLQLTSYRAADDLLSRPTVQQLHAGRLRRLDCALRDLTMLQHFPLLEWLLLRQVKRTTVEQAEVVSAEWLAPLELLPQLSELAFSDFKQLPLEGIRLPNLKFLRLMVPLLACDAQDALGYSLPAAARLRELEVCGPAHCRVDNEQESAPYDTPLDLMAAARQCVTIRVQGRSVVLDDTAGEFPGAAHQYVVEALRRGEAWQHVEFTLARPGPDVDGAVHVASDGVLEPVELEALVEEINTELGRLGVTAELTFLGTFRLRRVRAGVDVHEVLQRSS